MTNRTLGLAKSENERELTFGEKFLLGGPPYLGSRHRPIKEAEFMEAEWKKWQAPQTVDELISMHRWLLEEKWKRSASAVAIPVSQQMREDICNNPNNVRLVVGCSDGTTRIERVRIENVPLPTTTKGH
jgi:hypothetical protein